MPPRTSPAGTEHAGVWTSVGEYPPPLPSGVRRRSPVVLVVGLDHRVTRSCAIALEQLGLALAPASHGIAACEQIRALHPVCVVLGALLWRDEAGAVKAAALAIGARIIEVPPEMPSAWVTPMLTRELEALDATSSVASADACSLAVTRARR